MSAWKVVGMEKDWDGDPRLPANDEEVKGTRGIVPGTGRPDEVMYRMNLEKRTEGGKSFLDGTDLPKELLETATATVRVRYVDGDEEVTAERVEPITYYRIAAEDWYGVALDHLRNHTPPLLWGTP